MSEWSLQDAIAMQQRHIQIGETMVAKQDALVEELGMSAAAIRKAKSRVLRRLKQDLGELPS